MDCVIIGIGNTIRGDDGVGVHAVRYLAGRVPEGVELAEGSVYCPDLLPLLENRRKAVFIDGIDAGGRPGEIYRFRPDQVRQKTAVSLSLHDFGLYELINTAKLLEQCPEEVTIIAVQVKSVDLGEGLSEEVASALPSVHRLVLEEVGAVSER